MNLSCAELIRECAAHGMPVTIVFAEHNGVILKGTEPEPGFPWPDTTLPKAPRLENWR